MYFQIQSSTVYQTRWAITTVNSIAYPKKSRHVIWEPADTAEVYLYANEVAESDN